MRTRILQMLRDRAPRPLSGEELSASLGISRTAIWKHIQALKTAGYEIEAVPTKGYILRGTPDLLTPEEVAFHLETKWVGHSLRYFTKIKSTNDAGKAMAEEGCPDGTVIVAEEQTGGKGRLQRGWFSPYRGGVWVSIVFRPKFMPQDASKCTLMAAVAVIKAVNRYKGVNASIKWPNDVLLDGKKMVGILTEMSAEFGHINYIVVGTGINTHVSKDVIPEDIKDLAVSVADVAQEPVERVQVLADYLKYMEELYETVSREGFAPVLDEWRRYSNTLGQRVKVIAPDKTYFGTAEDIDEEGLLIVKKDDGTTEKVIAGDVSIRPADAKGRSYK